MGESAGTLQVYGPEAKQLTPDGPQPNGTTLNEAPAASQTI
jgi:hypothetical protein